jgi:hypothetical protein
MLVMVRDQRSPIEERTIYSRAPFSDINFIFYPFELWKVLSMIRRCLNRCPFMFFLNGTLLKVQMILFSSGLNVSVTINADELYCTLRTYVNWQRRQKDVLCAYRWLDVLSRFNQVHIPTNNVQSLTEYAVCLSGMSAPVGYMCSPINRLWLSEKSCLSVNLLTSTQCKRNFLPPLLN